MNKPHSALASSGQQHSSLGVLFDLDGVIIDSERSYTQIWTRIDSMFRTGVPDFPRVIKGMTLVDILNEYFPSEVHQRVVAYCVEEERKLVFNYMPGARELLCTLKGLGIPVALVTSSDAAKMEALHSKMPDLRQWFTAIVYGEMVSRGKPAPDPYLMGAKLIGVEPCRCAVVEDSLSGLRSGHDAGAYTVGMTDTLGRDAITGHADLVLDSLEDLDNLIECIRLNSEHTLNLAYKK